MDNVDFYFTLINVPTFFYPRATMFQKIDGKWSVFKVGLPLPTPPHARYDGKWKAIK